MTVRRPHVEGPEPAPGRALRDINAALDGLSPRITDYEVKRLREYIKSYGREKFGAGYIEGARNRW